MHRAIGDRLSFAFRLLLLVSLLGLIFDHEGMTMFFRTSFLRTTRCYSPEGPEYHILHRHRCANLKSNEMISIIKKMQVKVCFMPEVTTDYKLIAVMLLLRILVSAFVSRHECPQVCQISKVVHELGVYTEAKP